MRVHAAFGADGHIIALAEIVAEGDDRLGIRLVPGEDRKLAELTVPGECVGRPLAELAARYRVEEAADGPRLTLL
ncbi:hypothetical protein J2Z21_007139 [Streptomyces griseochromogenes]|uniref:Uncharacterized protein n=1 Tax=Streptomyces griseochromogenes TaxID=68214 RepID=A0A1B1AQ73_9ACTN|nr:hypothetical protein [Streptomyces griseochromogenes]ANP48714.1 hypothetical protein AVL59_03220 [Streptomyces griseochromogenes]MBP2054137.1 hypothetical protein [Streptomyces griseochromogenes]